MIAYKRKKKMITTNHNNNTTFVHKSLEFKFYFVNFMKLLEKWLLHIWIWYISICSNGRMERNALKLIARLSNQCRSSKPAPRSIQINRRRRQNKFSANLRVCRRYHFNSSNNPHRKWSYFSAIFIYCTYVFGKIWWNLWHP